MDITMLKQLIDTQDDRIAQLERTVAALCRLSLVEPEMYLEEDERTAIYDGTFFDQ